jgi:hypothetical protein
MKTNYRKGKTKSTSFLPTEIPDSSETVFESVNVQALTSNDGKKRSQ